jgi:VCBS repeat-containing protein
MPATNDIFASSENQTVTGNLFANNGDGVDTGAFSIAFFFVGPDMYTAGQTAPLPGGGTLTVNSDGTFTFIPGVGYDALFDGEPASFSFSYEDDNASTAVVTINIAGVNDAPIVSVATNSVNEDATVNGSVPAATDVDNGSSIDSYQLTGPAPTGLTFNTDGTYSYDASSYDSLAAGATQDIVVNYTATDNNGLSSAPQTLTITITGTNDAPVVSVTTNSVNEDATVSGNVPAATDVDGTVVSYQLTAAAPTGLTFNTDGSYSFDASSYDSLAAGATQDIVVSYTATD